MWKYKMILVLMLLTTGCPMDTYHGITIRNNSFSDIYVYGRFQFPDTSLADQKPILTKVAARKSNDLLGRDVGDSNLDRLTTETLTVFFLNKDTVDKYDWNSIRDNYAILRRLEVRESDLSSYVINFP